MIWFIIGIIVGFALCLWLVHPDDDEWVLVELTDAEGHTTIGRKAAN